MRQPVPFGKYLLLDRISVGGMAEVFKAKSYGVEGFEKIIAIKRILPTMGEDRDFIKMFIDEAKIAGQLAHANICQIFELGRIDGSHFIAMEYIWGKDLLQIQNRLRKIKQGMPVAMACFCIAKVLEGLDYAHRKRDPLGRPLEIVHRDCSPQNVLVSYEGEVKVIDFGIAKATSRNSRTMAGVLKGKFGYMSPEQVRGLPLDRRSDIFALGTMLYECLTGDRLFQGETDFSTLEKVRNVDIQRPRDVNPNIPEAVERVIMKALAKDVDERYQWCSEMLADLQQFLMGQDVVFTAKSLSSWLKEVFSTEIDKERQLLEQYKRVGRDGLIAGVPAAEAKLDVVGTLGEAGAPEGDATQLGGPSFLEDMEQAASQAMEAGPAPGSPAARGKVDDDTDGDFGEEAPTEIFGEIDHGPKPPNPTPQPRVSAKQPTNTPAPQTTRPTQGSSPPMVGNGRAPTASQPPMAAAPAAANDATMNITDSDLVPAAGSARDAYAAAFPHLAAKAGPAPGPQPGFQQPPGYPQGQPMALGTPGAMPTTTPPVLNALAAPGGPNAGRTLMGAAAPPGFGVYGSHPPGSVPPQQQPYPLPGVPPQQQPQQHYGNSPQQGTPPQQGMPQQQHYQQHHPSQPQMHSHGMQPSPEQMSQYPSAQNYLAHMPGPHTGPMGAYAQYQTPTAAIEQQPEGRKKRASIGRDIAIGVMIAAIVLGGFLAVKFLVLDDGEEESTASGETKPVEIAKLKIEMPEGVTARVQIDGKDQFQSVKTGQELSVEAGSRKVKIIAANGENCERQIELTADKPTIFECKMPGAGSGSQQPTPDAPKQDSKVAQTDPAKDPVKVDPKTDPKADPKTDPKVDPKLDPKTDPKLDPKADPKLDPKCAPPQRLVNGKCVEVKDPKLDPKVDPPKDPRKKLDADKGSLTVTSTPSAKITVDGADTGRSTPMTIQLPPGKHKVAFIVGGDKFTYTVNVKAGEVTKLHKDLQ